MAEVTQEGVVRDASREEASVEFRSTSSEAVSNGVGRGHSGPIPFVPPSGRFATAEEMNTARSTPGARTFELDLSDPQVQAALMADIIGSPDFINTKRAVAGSEFNDSLLGKTRRVLETRIQVQHVVAAVLVAGVLYIAWEGVAAYFGWNFRTGLFGSKTLMPENKVALKRVA